MTPTEEDLRLAEEWLTGYGHQRTTETLAAFRAEARREVEETCDGHGYLRSQIAELEAAIQCKNDLTGPCETPEEMCWEHELRSEREACERIVEERLQSAAAARDRAIAAGREGVGHCRQSDVETCEGILRRLRERAKEKS